MGFIAVSVAGIAAIKALCGITMGISFATLGTTVYFNCREEINNFFTGPVKDFFTGKYFRREQNNNEEETNNEVNENTPLIGETNGTTEEIETVEEH